MTSEIVQLPGPRAFPRVSLMEPSDSHYLLLAGQVDRRPMPLPPSRRKRGLLAELADASARTRAVPGVIGAHLFDAILRPRGESRLLAERPDAAPRPSFDVVMLAEARDPDVLRDLRSNGLLGAAEQLLAGPGGQTLTTELTNVRRIAPVDHDRGGVFLFNFFYADDVEQNLGVWEYTAGWFQDQTGLDNSTVLLPRDPTSSPYTLINHCRWDRLRDILVPLRFRRSFRPYVLGHFDANRTAPMPILYRLVT